MVYPSIRSTMLVVAIAAGCALPSAAQEIAPVRAGTWELNAALGFTRGLSQSETGSAENSWNGGATLSYGLTDLFLPYMEYNHYFGGTGARVGGVLNPELGTQFRGNFDLSMSDIHGGLHLRLTRRESRIAPYLVVGLGLLRVYGGSVRVEYQVEPGGPFSPLPQPLTVPSSNHLAVNFGGGLRAYLTQHVGLRFEGKAYRATSPDDPGAIKFGTFGKFQFGFFYQF
jgi:hypothetical protein